MSRVRQAYFPLRGGLDMRSPMLQVDPGTAALIVNYEVAETGGYRRTGGFERFDGRPAPSSGSYPGSQEALRAVIEPVPGEGPVRGVAIYGGRVWAFRDDGSAQAKLWRSSSTGWEAMSTPTRGGGGRYEFALYNFTGDSGDLAIYGVDGVNDPFEIKGTTFTELDPGVSSVAAQHIAAHKAHLFVSYPGGSVLHSGIGDPTNWDSSTGGAGEIAKGDEITGIEPIKGDALAIFGNSTTHILYGSSEADWVSAKLSNHADGAGALPGTIQTFMEPIFMDDVGLRGLSSVQAYGNFRTRTLSDLVQPLVEDMRSRKLFSTVLRQRSQYRLLDDTGRCLILTMDGGKSLGFGLAAYPFKPRCAAHGDIDGVHTSVVGAEDGRVYMLDRGDSFDGEPIQAFLRLNFHIAGSPTTQKRWRKAVIDVTTEEMQNIKIQPIFNFGHADTASATVIDTEQFVVTGLQGVYPTGGVWGVDNWGEFQWDGQILAEAYADLVGSGRSIALVLYSESTHAPPFTLNGVVLHYSIRGLRR